MTNQSTRPLGEIADLIRGITFKPTDLVESGNESGVACFRTKNIQASLDDQDLIYVPSVFIKNSSQYVSAGDTLISTANSHNLVGKVCWVPELDYSATLGGFISLIRARPELVLPKYLYYWLSSDTTQERFRRLARQTTNISNLPLADVAKELVPVPPLDEQERIVKLLDEADALRKLRAEADRRMGELVPALFYEMFGSKDEQRGWPWMSLGHVGAEFRYGTSNKSSSNGYPTLRIPSVVDGTLNLSDLKRVAVSESDLERLRLQEGDLLFVRSNGNPDYVGRSSVFHMTTLDGNDSQADEWIFASYLIRCRIDPESIRPIFLHAYLSGGDGRNELRSHARTSAGQYNINIDDLRSVSVPMPPVQLQLRFEHLVSRVSDIGVCASAASSELAVAFASLLATMMRPTAL